MTDATGRPIAVVEVDGVLVLDHPTVPVTETVVHAYGNRWARRVKVPVGADVALRRLAERFDIVWAFAAGRPWAWIDDSIHDLGRLDDPPDGIFVPVDSGSGIMSVDPLRLQRGIDRLTACPPSPGSPQGDDTSTAPSLWIERMS